MLSRASLSVVLLFLCAFVNAQFGFFDGMFRQQQEYHQPSGASQWAAHLESVSCNRYLCPATLDCDVKCTLPDKDSSDGATVICVRGDNECTQIGALSRKWSK
ncbi:hypothetical protein BDZ89DRAFT_1055619 [Hymenopellis radicata]|nr:hypothetical protein BDZ89DRAFT_1055619 [Hymenopellis radicata]